MYAYLISPFSLFLESGGRVYWLYLLSAVTFSVVLFVVKPGGERSASLVVYLLPVKTIFHRSAINDYVFFYANALFQGTFVVTYFSSLSMIVSAEVLCKLIEYFPEIQAGLSVGDALVGVVLTVFLAMTADFAIFIGHYLQHRLLWLWEFHKVHHSAEVMTPITVFRMHPVDNILTFSLAGFFSGTALGVVLFLTGGEFNFYNVAGVNVLLIVFYLCGYNLRHSHVWLSFGPFFSRIFISPAQHQIHHSASPAHFDKNLGFMFAFWDALFGTLYVPKQKELIDFGLGEKENERFSSFWSLYLMPFYSVVKNFRVPMLFQPKRYVSVLIFVGVVFPAVYLNQKNNAPVILAENVFLQDMTWMEVDRAIKSGINTILIPTGGTEQNGPHMILGKHNYIVKYTAGKIAEQIGSALVAPVLSYVPEGRVDLADGHMRFAGTLSVSDSVFASTLEFAARSMYQHGFKVIAFVGDSGGNQAMQALVADKLNAEWSNQGISVIHVGDYYKQNGQFAYLLGQGFSPVQIGGHAGIRDSSELLAVYPEGIRAALLKDYSNTVFSEVGADGDAGKASVVLGRILLDLKVSAAVKQLRGRRN